MLVENDYDKEVYNGERRVAHRHGEGRACHRLRRPEVTYGFGELDELPVGIEQSCRVKRLLGGVATVRCC